MIETKKQMNLTPTNTQTALIANLAKEIWYAHYIPIIGQQQVDYMLDKFYADASLCQQMSEGQTFYLIEKENEVIGFVSVSEKEKGDWFIHKFYIQAKQQGKGAGKEVFQKLLDIISPVKTIRLTVNRKNYKSINFYFKNGFVIEKVEDFDIGEGYLMEDFVMVFKSNHTHT